jgi:hypothetical protein
MSRPTGLQVRRVAVVAMTVAFLAPPAWALNFFELEVYPATTEGKGLHEVESHTNFVADGHQGDGEQAGTHRLLRTSLEYNYGLTDAIDVAAYLDLEKGNGEEPSYAGSRFRIRGSLGEKGRWPVDLGWYFEAEVPHNEPATDLELEFRPILSRDIGRFSVDLNPGFDLPTVTRERRTLEFSYSARVYYRLARSLEPAIEFYGGIGQVRRPDGSQDQQHYVFPVLNARPWHGIGLSLGPGFGLTRASDAVLVRLSIEYEFALGGGRSSGSAY